MAREELVFTDYLEVILRRKWLIAMVVVLVTILTYGWALRERPIYESRARIKVQRQVNLAELLDQVMVSSGDPIQNYVFEIKSYLVASNAAAILTAPQTPADADIRAVHGAVSVERIKDTDLLDIITSGAVPEQSKRRCEAVVLAFIRQHDYAIQKNAQDVFESIKESYDKLMTDFRKRQSQVLQSLGPSVIGSGEFDQLTAMRRRLSDFQARLHDLRISGNYTEEYPEIVNLKGQIGQIETNIAQTLQADFDKRNQLDQYESYKAIIKEIEVFFSRRIEEAKIAVNKKSEIVMVIEPASEGVPITTGKWRKTVAGALLGLILGVAMAFVRDTMDTSVRTISEIEELFHLHVLGVIPWFSHYDVIVPVSRSRLVNWLQQTFHVRSLRVHWKQAKDSLLTAFGRPSAAKLRPSELVVPFYPRSPATEAYRTLRTNLQLDLQPGSNALLVTSAAPGEGKTTTNVNLAVAFAQGGKRVLLVNANMRRPQICRIFGLQRNEGLSDILVGDIPWRDAIKDYRDVALGGPATASLATAAGMDNLFFITCGGRTVHPAEWLSQPMLKDLIREWMAAFDLVLVDAPPVLPVPDSVILASIVKQTMIVYEVGETARESVRRAVASLQKAGTVIKGMVLNGLRASWANNPEFFHYRTFYGRRE
ncbi:MAG: polysaccharide biosynthesis tyrosine autokinase [Lentisphaerae bacterium]|nr:polysaccharide biosynthesis tyrosine autokinase [Lentisphaerota bacterium]